MWCRLPEREAAVGAHEVTAEISYPTLGIKHHHSTFTLFQCRINRTKHAFVILLRGDQFINDKFYIVSNIPIQRPCFRELVNLPVYPHLLITPFCHGFEQLLVMSMSSHNYRRKHNTFLSKIILNYKSRNLLISIFYH